MKKKEQLGVFNSVLTDGLDLAQETCNDKVKKDI